MSGRRRLINLLLFFGLSFCGLVASAAGDFDDEYFGFTDKTYVISSSRANLELDALFGTKNPIRATIVIKSGITVRSTSTSHGAIYRASGRGGYITIINNGTIHGMGGAGGGSSNWYGGNGQSGGPAITLSGTTRIINYGKIFGGGGGGAASAATYCKDGRYRWWHESRSHTSGGGGGAGGGAGGRGHALNGHNYTSQNSGKAGTTGSGGRRGASGSNLYRGASYRGYKFRRGAYGGDYGCVGGNGYVCRMHWYGSGPYKARKWYTYTTYGGAAGKAVVKNGYSLTQEGSWDWSHVRGGVQ